MGEVAWQYTPREVFHLLDIMMHKIAETCSVRSAGRLVVLGGARQAGGRVSLPLALQCRRFRATGNASGCGVLWRFVHRRRRSDLRPHRSAMRTVLLKQGALIEATKRRKGQC